MQSGKKFILYGLSGSQPPEQSEYEFKIVNIPKGEHETEEYAKINPIQLVPALSHGDFHLGEGSAILVYLAKVWNDQKYYSDEPKKCGRIHMYLSYHSTVREAGPLPFRDKFRVIIGKYIDIPSKQECYEKLEGMCKEFERIWLSNGNKFIIGDELTICDLHAFTEFQQSSVACGYDFSQKFPKIHDWMKRIYDIPEFKDVDKGVLAAVDFFGKSVTPPSKN